MRARGLLIVATVTALGGSLVAAEAEHAPGHPDWSCCPAVRSFPADFPALTDSEWGYPLGGWGGIARGHPIERTPVIFVHGNSEDASFWDLQNESELAVNVRRRFRDAGYSDQELWALSYNGARCGNNTCQTSNDVNVPDLAAFIRAVLDYTGAERFDVVAHSLGVTLTRKTLVEHADLLVLAEDLVFASGANHGTTLCRGAEGFVGCDEIHPGSPWLAELNAHPIPPLVRTVTICDCTGVADHFFLAVDARSPQLAGAENLELPGSAHLVTARGPDAVALYLPLVERDSRLGGVVRVRDTSQRRPLPATGVPFAPAVALVLLGAAALVARASRRAA